MSSRWAVVPFLVLGILLALGVAQVPQPYRAALVCALPIIAAVLFVIKQAAHVAEFKFTLARLLWRWLREREFCYVRGLRDHKKHSRDDGQGAHQHGAVGLRHLRHAQRD